MGDSNGRVTILDRHELHVSVVEHALSRRGYHCRGMVPRESGTRAIVSDVNRSHPDVVLTGVSLGHVDVIDVLGALRREGHRVVALVERDEPRLLGQALATGVAAVIARSCSIEDLETVLAKTLRDEPVITMEERSDLILRYLAGVDQYAVRMARLTRHERGLLAHLMEGRTVCEVARIRTVSEATVRTQAKSVLLKLEVSCQLTAVAVAWRSGHTPHTLGKC